MMLAGRALAAALNELIEAISARDLITINCGRCIEGLRKIMVPADPTRKLGWTALQVNLNLSRSYREYITIAFTEPRHGDRAEAERAQLEEVMERSWTIMKRFMEYRKRGDKALPLDDFPLFM